MNCRDFDRWLDEGQPRDAQTAANAHADGCAHCAASLTAARELRQVLSQRFATTSHHFTEGVMSRIDARAHRPLLSPAFEEPTFPWWIRALQEPGTVLAFVLGAVLLAWGQDLADLTALMAAPVARYLIVDMSWMRNLGAADSSPLLPWGLVLAAAVTAATWGLFRVSMLVAAGRSGR